MDIISILIVASAAAPLPYGSDDMMAADAMPEPEQIIVLPGDTLYPFVQILPSAPLEVVTEPIHGQIFDISKYISKHPKIDAAKAKAKAVAKKSFSLARAGAMKVKPIADVTLDVVLAAVAWVHK